MRNARRAQRLDNLDLLPDGTIKPPLILVLLSAQ
jgi:hypothetical protein